MRRVANKFLSEHEQKGSRLHSVGSNTWSKIFFKAIFAYFNICLRQHVRGVVDKETVIFRKYLRVIEIFCKPVLLCASGLNICKYSLSIWKRNLLQISADGPHDRHRDRVLHAALPGQHTEGRRQVHIREPII